jgi:hypothetical protein
MTTSLEWLLRCWSSSDISNVVSPIINTFFFGCGFNYHQSVKPLGKRRYSLLFTGLSLRDPSVFVRRRGTRGKELVSSEIRQVVEGEGFCWEKGWTSHLRNFWKNDCLFFQASIDLNYGVPGFWTNRTWTADATRTWYLYQQQGALNNFRTQACGLELSCRRFSMVFPSLQERSKQHVAHIDMHR